MSRPLAPCNGRRILVHSITCPGWKWSCNWPFARLGRPCVHTAEHMREHGDG